MIVKQLNDDWVEVGEMTMKISAITAIRRPRVGYKGFDCKIGTFFHTVYDISHEEAMQAYDDLLKICIEAGMGRCA